MEGALNNEGDNMAKPVDVSQPASSCPKCWHNRYQSSHSGRDGSYAWAQQHQSPLSKGDLVTAKHPASSNRDRRQVPERVSALGDQPGTW